MRNIILILLSLLVASVASAQDIYLKQNNFFTELVLNGASENIKDVQKQQHSITLFFKKKISADFSGGLNDPFIKKIIAKGDSLTIEFAPNTDFAFMTEAQDAKVVASRTRQADDIKLGYGIEQAIMKRGLGIIENTEAQRQLGISDELFAKQEFEAALLQLESLISSDVNSFYKQEALYRLGNTYFALGEKSYKNYITASQIFDDFTNLYPDSYLFRDALIRSAEAKEKADMYYEAIFAYEKIIRLVNDEQIRRKAYLQIADLYQMLGQIDRAIEARENYIKRFQGDKDPQTAIIAMLYAEKGDLDNAFKYFSSLTGRKVDYSKFSPESLYIMGDVFDKKRRYEEAYNAFRRVYSFYPSFKDADMAMYRSATMQEKLNNKTQAESLFLDTVAKYPDKPGGMLAAIDYANLDIKAKKTEDWEKFLAPALKSSDIEINEKANLVIIKSFFNEKDYAKTIEQIDKFGKNSYNSPLMTEVFDIKQQARLSQAKTAYKDGELNKAQEYIRMMLNEFPDTAYSKEAKTIDQEISYGQVKEKYELGDYKGVIDFTENFLADELEIIEPSKWYNLLDDAYYARIKQNYSTNKTAQAMIEAKQYIAQFGNEGAHINGVREIADAIVERAIKNNFDDERFVNVIQNYSENNQIINDSKNDLFKDTVRSYTAFALFKVSMQKEAAEMLASVGKNKNSTYWLTNLLLGNGEINFQVNALDPLTLTFIAEEAEKKNPDTAIKLLDEYTKDPKLAEKLKFKISKNISNSTKREVLLVKIYKAVTEEPAKRFEGYEEVLLDMGILYFKKNSFRSAISSLENFLKQYPARDDKRAEALYYTAKSYLKLKENNNAVKSYMELLESIPNSIYAGVARTELEDIEWRKSLTN